MFCECRDVQVSYGSTTVLDAEHLAIPTRRTTAVVGHNGSGKTTLLEVLALLRKPTRGTLTIWGKPAETGNRGLRSGIVMVMHPGYLFRGTVWDNVLYGLHARRVRRKESWRRAVDALEMVDLAAFARRDIRELSAGERQRVNLARAIVIRPRALLLDEPTANVDTRSVGVLHHILRQLRDERGTTIVHTSPADNELEDVTDHTVELVEGRVIEPAGVLRNAPSC